MREGLLNSDRRIYRFDCNFLLAEKAIVLCNIYTKKFIT
jgi:hypothetical protein